MAIWQSSDWCTMWLVPNKEFDWNSREKMTNNYVNYWRVEQASVIKNVTGKLEGTKKIKGQNHSNFTIPVPLSSIVANNQFTLSV